MTNNKRMWTEVTICIVCLLICYIFSRQFNADAQKNNIIPHVQIINENNRIYPVSVEDKKNSIKDLVKISDDTNGTNRSTQNDRTTIISQKDKLLIENLKTEIISINKQKSNTANTTTNERDQNINYRNIHDESIFIDNEKSNTADTTTNERDQNINYRNIHDKNIFIDDENNEVPNENNETYVENEIEDGHYNKTIMSIYINKIKNQFNSNNKSKITISKNNSLDKTNLKIYETCGVEESIEKEDNNKYFNTDNNNTINNDDILSDENEIDQNDEMEYQYDEI